jgi:hypothetical protein
MLQSIIAQSVNSSTVQLSPITTALTVEQDTTSDSVYWFNAYKASEFPELTVDKDYIFLWSTDHDNGPGGIWIGKGDNLDLSDFIEVAQLFTGSQAETPFLYRDAGAARPILLYYHIAAGDCPGQNTRLKTTAGGAIDSLTFTDETQPIGCQGTVDGVTQNHTGYMRFYDIDGQRIANHYLNGSIPPTYQRSNANNLYAFSNINTFTQYNPFLDSGRTYHLSWGAHFNFNGVDYMFINSIDLTDNFSAGNNPTGLVHLVKVNSSLEITELVADITTTEDQGFQIYVDLPNMKAHFYRQSGRVDKPDTFLGTVGYASLDLSFLTAI